MKMNLLSGNSWRAGGGHRAAEGRACGTDPAAAALLSSVGQGPAAKLQSAWHCPRAGPGRQACSERSVITASPHSSQHGLCLLAQLPSPPGVPVSGFVRPAERWACWRRSHWPGGELPSPAVLASPLTGCAAPGAHH